MKIAVRGGHTPKSTGAVGILNELTENRKVYPEVIRLLREQGHEVHDVTPPDTLGNGDELAYGVNKANALGVDLFISIHFNNAYKTYNGGIGSEVLVYRAGNTASVYAQRVVNKLATTGLKNRGLKPRPELYELRKTNMPAMIVEICFVEATEDVAIYRRVGVTGIAKLIVEGVIGKDIVVAQPQPQPQQKTQGESLTVKFQRFLNDNGFTDYEGKKLELDGKFGPRSKSALEKLIKSL
jgi:N-acetylmuramoyl-L-alanine amidase